MAALDNNTPTPNNTDQVIITDKDTTDEYDKDLIKINGMSDYDFKRSNIWKQATDNIRENYRSCTANFHRQTLQIKQEKENIENAKTLVEHPNFNTLPKKDQEEFKNIYYKKGPNVLKFNRLQKKKSVVAIKLGNAIISKKRQMAETLLCEYKKVLDDIMETAEVLSEDNDFCGAFGNVYSDKLEAAENEGLYLMVCKRCKKDWAVHSFRVKLLVNEYYRL